MKVVPTSRWKNRPKFVGSGAGRWMMNRAIERAWSQPIRRFWVHTCTLDHPAAVAFYIRSGFVPFRRRIEIAAPLPGERTLCENRKVYGINQSFDAWPKLSGSWAEYIYLQPGSTVFRLPDGVTPEQAIALGCAAPTAVHGVLDVVKVKAGDTVVVQGSGPVGLAAAMYAHYSGAAKVILVGGPASRLDLAKEIGVGDVHFDVFDGTSNEDRLKQILAETPAGYGADVVLECTGVPAAVAEGMEMARKNGRYLVLGQYTDRGTTPINPHVITKKQLQVYGSWTFAERHYERYLQLLPAMAQRFQLEKLVTPYPLTEANQAMSDMAEGKVMKPVLVMQ